MRATMRRAGRHWLVFGLGLLLAACAAAPVATPVATPAPTPAPTGDVLAEAAAAIAAQTKETGLWDGPLDGVARARTGVEIDYVAADGSNGGVMGVFAGVEEAAAAMGWTPVLRDGNGTPDGRTAALRAAIAAKPAAIIVGGFDPSEQKEAIEAATAAHIVLVGWHAGSMAGPDPESELFTNVTTRPSEVATLAADFVIDDSHGHAGVAIFTDSQYAIALDKANIMKAQVERCGGCTVLAYRDVAILDSVGTMPSVLHELQSQFKGRLTYLLAINGNYFAGSKQGLMQEGVKPDQPPQAVAAGDGDRAEFDRIRNGDYQLASVAEPLNLQGWQLVDEINRALAGAKPSTYVPAPGLITRTSVPAEGKTWDPVSKYRDTYKRIWGVGQ